jgi:Helix-turn-helix domain
LSALIPERSQTPAEVEAGLRAFFLDYSARYLSRALVAFCRAGGRLAPYPVRAPPEVVLMTEAEAAKLLRCSVETLRRRRRERSIGFRKLGAHIFYTPGDLAAYVERNHQCPADPPMPASAASSSANSGSPAVARPVPGVEPGSTSAADRLAEYHSARRILKRHD